MDLIGNLIKYIEKFERLIVITVVLSLSSIVMYLSERSGFLDFTELPAWVRPTCTIVAVVAVIHVGVRSIMTAPRLLNWASSLPMRHRTALANRVLVRRMLEMKGIPREVVCYARHRESDQIWTPNDRDEPNWLRELKRAGLVEPIDGGSRITRYRIHRVAWDYIKRRPNKFICKVPWESPPWTQRFNDEKRVNEMLESSAG